MAEETDLPGGSQATGQTATTETGETTAAAAPPSTMGGGQTQDRPSSSPSGVTAAAEMSAAAATSPAQQAQADAWREAGKQYGLDFSGFTDQTAALRHLAEQNAQARQLAQYGQHYLQHHDQFQQYQRWAQQWQQYHAQQQAASQRPKVWDPPEYDKGWGQLVEQDPATGEFKLKQGTSPDILPKYLKYQQYRRDWADKFLSNPVETLQPMIDERAQAIAQQMMQGQLGSYRDEVYANGFVDQNSSWLHQRDQSGQILMDPATGRRALTAEGQRFAHYVRQAEGDPRQGGLGLANPQQVEAYARSMLQRDLLLAQYQRGQAGQQNQQIKQGFIQENRLANVSGAIPQGGPGKSGGGNGKLSLREQMMAAAKAEGLKDSDLLPS